MTGRPLTPVATVPPATVTIPMAGDGVTSLGVETHVQPVINSIEWLRTKVPGANLSTALLDLVYPPEDAFGLLTGATDWGFASTGAAGIDRGYCYQLHVVTLVDAMRIPLNTRLVQGMVIRAMAVDFVGKNGHGALPASMPNIQLIKFARSIGTGYSALTGAPGPTVTAIDTKTDPSASTATYEVLHSISKTLAAPETVDLSAFNYYLYIYGEYGANALQHSAVFDSRLSVSA